MNHIKSIIGPYHNDTKTPLIMTIDGDDHQGHIDLNSLGYAWQANSLDSTPARWKISHNPSYYQIMLCTQSYLYQEIWSTKTKSLDQKAFGAIQQRRGCYSAKDRVLRYASYLLACNQLFFVQPYLHTTDSDQHDNRLNQLTIGRWLWFRKRSRRLWKKRCGAANHPMEFLSQAPFSASPTSLLVYIGWNFETAGIQSHRGSFSSILTSFLYPQLPSSLPSQYEQFWSHPGREDSRQVGVEIFSREYLNTWI